MLPTISPYTGGKARLQIRKWILDLIPPARKDQTYVEPFAGMLSILLSRPKAGVEIVNDRSDRIVNMWQVYQKDPDEFIRRISKVLWSETFYQWAKENVDCVDPYDRALAVFMVLKLSQEHSAEYFTGMGVGYSPAGHPRRHHSEELLYMIWQRIKSVQFLNRCALKLLKRIAREKGAVIYCDPPYIGTENKFYEGELDYDEFKDLLSQQKGLVALSGEGDFYDDLGWHKHELDGVQNAACGVSKSKKTWRTECLWTNYDPREYKSPLFLEHFST